MKGKGEGRREEEWLDRCIDRYMDGYMNRSVDGYPSVENSIRCHCEGNGNYIFFIYFRALIFFSFSLSFSSVCSLLVFKMVSRFSSSFLSSFLSMLYFFPVRASIFCWNCGVWFTG